MRVLVPVALIGVLLTGCASSGVQRALTPNDRLRDQVRELEKMVVDLQKKATVSEVEVARLKERVVELEVDRERLEEQLAQRPAPRPPSPTRGLSEEPLPSFRPATSARIETADLEDPDPLPPPTRSPAASEPPKSAPVVVPRSSPEPRTAQRKPVRRAPAPEVRAAEPAAAPTVEVPPAGQAIYDQGYTQYHRGQYVDAEASFLRFLEGFPSTDLSDNAQFWIGEARFARDDFRGALSAFREVVDRFPGGNKVPDALVKAGAALEALGDVAGARRSYEEVQRRFPTSPAALRAEERTIALR